MARFQPWLSPKIPNILSFPQAGRDLGREELGKDVGHGVCEGGVEGRVGRLGGRQRCRDAAERLPETHFFTDNLLVRVHFGQTRGLYFVAEQAAPSTHLAHPEGCAALTNCASHCAPCEPLLQALS